MKSLILSSILALAFTTQLRANDTNTFDIALEIGKQSDSHLAIAEIDQTEKNSDLATVFGLTLTGELTPITNLTISGFINHNQSEYDEARGFDQASLIKQIGIGYELSGFTLSTSQVWADAKLEDRNFLTLRQSEFSISRLFDNAVFLRLSTNKSDKQYRGFSERNGELDEQQLDLFKFFGDSKSFVKLSVATLDNQTIDESFIYSGDQWNLAYSHRLDFFSLDHQLKLFRQQENKDYQAFEQDTDVFGQPLNSPQTSQRIDKKAVWGVTIDTQLSEHFASSISFENTDSQSSLAEMNYNSNRISFMLKATF